MRLHRPIRFLVLSLALAALGPWPVAGQATTGEAGAVPTPELFAVDASHSEASFGIRHLGLSRVRGTFSQLTGSLLFDAADPTRSSVTVVIQVASLFTANERRDDDLRENFFEVAQFPEIVFQSTRVERTGDDLTLVGDLRIRDVVREVSIPVVFLGGVVNEQNGNRIVGFEGELSIDRRDWDVAREGHPAEIARTIGYEVSIDLQLEAVKQDFGGVGFQDGERASVGRILSEALESGGIPAAETRFREIQESDDEVNLSPREFGVLGMRLVQAGRVDEAVAVFELARTVHPDVPQLDEWLGHALAAAGRSQDAVESYERVLEAAPRSTASIEMLRFLTGRRDRMTLD